MVYSAEEWKLSLRAFEAISDYFFLHFGAIMNFGMSCEMCMDGDV